MSLAIAYHMKKKANHMAKGGMAEDGPCRDHGQYMCHMCHGGKMAEGGFVEEEKASGFEPNPRVEDHEERNPYEVGMRKMEDDYQDDSDEEDMIGRIMKMRAEKYSEGGRVSNDTPITADFEKNQFDDLVKDDDLEEHYTGENSGDEIGNSQEDEDRRDIIDRIMASRRKKDRMPHPA